MKILTPGHKYQLDHFENFGLEGCPVQTLQFIEKEHITKEPGSDAVVDKLVTVNDGTTNEEVLAVLIDRMQFLDAKFPCMENKDVLTGLRFALDTLNKRTADRKARGVEGEHKA